LIDFKVSLDYIFEEEKSARKYGLKQLKNDEK
jgi:hypothetical protein